MQHSSISNAFRLGDLILFGIQRLKEADIDNPELDARILIAHSLKLDRAQLLSQADRDLSEKEARLAMTFIECRARHEPVARILGHREFWSLDFGLNEATLEPRPDSETLIEATLSAIKDRKESLHIADLGTGTGCLLLSLLHELPLATGLGIDKSRRALEQAKANAVSFGLDDRAQFKENNWLDHIDQSFDIVISNPPYISEKDMACLMPEVRDFDPKMALYGGDDGLDAYRHIIPQAKEKLKSKGIITLEFGLGQDKAVSTLLKEHGFIDIKTRKDLAGVTRCVTAYMP
ncbi:MAG: peptide chain release factor N(5)-glutamine methyltransferase [Alphaproteobacteria bacterium]